MATPSVIARMVFDHMTESIARSSADSGELGKITYDTAMESCLRGVILSLDEANLVKKATLDFVDSHLSKNSHNGWKWSVSPGEVHIEPPFGGCVTLHLAPSGDVEIKSIEDAPAHLEICSVMENSSIFFCASDRDPWTTVVFPVDIVFIWTRSEMVLDWIEERTQ